MGAALEAKKSKELIFLAELATQMRGRRTARGAIILNRPKPKVQSLRDKTESVETDKEGSVASEIEHILIEELMVLSNVTVAREIHGCFGEKAVLRKHPKMVEKNLEEIDKFAKKLVKEKQLDLGAEIKSFQDISKFCQTLQASGPKGDTLALIFSGAVASRLQRAYYFCPSEEAFIGHFGLAVPVYTHFTSPIRRYTDILVHRQLAKKMGEKKEHNSLGTIQATLDHVNDRYFHGKKVGLKSCRIWAKKVLEANLGQKLETLVVDLRENRVEVYIPEIGLEFDIYMEKEETLLWFFSEKDKTLHRTKELLASKSSIASPKLNKIFVAQEVKAEVVEVPSTANKTIKKCTLFLHPE